MSTTGTDVRQARALPGGGPAGRAAATTLVRARPASRALLFCHGRTGYARSSDGTYDNIANIDGGAMPGRARFRQSDLTRALRGVEKGGMCVARIEIEASGKIVIFSGSALSCRSPSNPWDEELSR